MLRPFKTLLLLLVLAPCIASAQRYDTRTVITAADSIFSYVAGDSVYRYCTYDSASYYQYRKHRKPQYHALAGDSRTKKRFYRAYIRYKFVMPYPACTDYDTVKGEITFELNDSLGLIKEPDLSFIPDLMLKNDSCHFISRDEALSLAHKQKLKKGVVPPRAFIKYRPEEKKFVWVILNIIWDDKDVRPERATMDDMVVLDAETGKMVSHKVVPYTAVIR